MATMNLKTGLARMIAEVEKLPPITVFRMGQYSQCVIGKTVKWDPKFGNDVGYDEAACEISLKTLRRLFGIKKPSKASQWNKPFSSDADNMYTEKTWAVIRLFTAKITQYSGGEIARDDWLKLAKAQLEKMQ